MPIRVIYAGTPDFAVPALQALINDPEYEVVAVYTQPDRPAGRGRALQQSPVKRLAMAHQIPVEQPLSLKDDTSLQQYPAEFMVVAAYGLLLPDDVLTWPDSGCINIHASLLPRWRGAAPIQYALAAGDKETGISIMQMEAGLDTGPVWCQTNLHIDPDMSAASLHDHLAALGADALIKCLATIRAGETRPTPQAEECVTYASKLSKSDGKLDWTQNTLDLHNQIRAYNPWPVAFTTHSGQTIRIWAATPGNTGQTAQAGTVVSEDGSGIGIQTGDGVLLITELQLPGKQRIPSTDFLNSRSLLGEVLE